MPYDLICFLLRWFTRNGAARVASKTGQYLVLLCSWRESVDLWAQLNKHLCYSPNPVMKSSVFIVLGAEVLIILLPLLQRSYGAVFSKENERKRGKHWLFFLKPRSRAIVSCVSSRWHCTLADFKAQNVTDYSLICWPDVRIKSFFFK